MGNQDGNAGRVPALNCDKKRGPRAWSSRPELEFGLLFLFFRGFAGFFAFDFFLEVSVKYTGKLINGEVFDSTDNRGGEPARFQLNRVIPGWTEGMQHMKEGAVYEFYIPANLAYGERGRPGIPGNSVLIFNVELLEVFPGATPANTRPGQPVTSDIIKVPSAEELKKGAQIENAAN